jgi:hypothetical protein
MKRKFISKRGEQKEDGAHCRMKSFTGITSMMTWVWQVTVTGDMINAY